MSQAIKLFSTLQMFASHGKLGKLGLQKPKDQLQGSLKNYILNYHDCLNVFLFEAAPLVHGIALLWVGPWGKKF